MNDKIRVSIPLDYGEVQAAHDIIKLQCADQDIKALKSSAKYLYTKSKEASNKNYPDDAMMLEELGKLALSVIPDVEEEIEADKI